MTKPKKSNARYHVPNLSRALEVFELLAKNTNGMSLPEMVKLTKYSKNSIFRILCTLEDNGYVTHNERGNFSLSRKLAALGYASFGELNIVEKSMDILRNMRDELGETAMLGTLLEEGCILLDQAPGRYPLKFLGEIGMPINLYASAPGKAFLAFLPKSESDEKLKKIVFKKFNNNTITSKIKFSAELEIVRKNGYAVDNCEEIAGVACIGAPVFDSYGYPIASIWITGPVERIKPLGYAKLGGIIASYASIISKRFGYGYLNS